LKVAWTSSPYFLNYQTNALNGALNKDVQEISDTFFHALPDIRAKLLMDADAMMSGDPAAISNAEVIRTYPGFYAVAVYRLAHALFHLKVC